MIALTTNTYPLSGSAASFFNEFKRKLFRNEQFSLQSEKKIKNTLNFKSRYFKMNGF